MTNILIADDWPVFQAGVKGVLAESLKEASLELKSISELFEADMATLRGYHVVILSLQPSERAKAFIANLRKRKVGAKIIVISGSNDVVDAKYWFASEVDGYLAKSTDAETLVKAVTTVLGNRRFIETSMLLNYLCGERRPGAGNRAANLSSRQNQIMRYLASGFQQKDIARMLGLNVNTVSIHKTNIFRKMRVANLNELIMLLGQQNPNQSWAWKQQG